MATHSFTCKQVIPAFTLQPQSITAQLADISFDRPMEGRRLSRLRWLVTYRNKVPPRESNPDTVTHPSTNRTQRRLTSLIETNELQIRQAANSDSFAPWFKTHLFRKPFPP